MSEFQDRSKLFAGMFGDFIKAAERLGEIESLERAHAEAQQRLDTINEQVAAVGEQHKDMLAQARTDAHQTSAEILAKAHKEADKLVEEASQKAEIIIAKAKKEEAAAASRTAQVESAAEKNLAHVGQQLANLEEKINTRQNELTALLQQTEAITAQYRQGKTLLDDLRKTLK